MKSACNHLSITTLPQAGATWKPQALKKAMNYLNQSSVNEGNGSGVKPKGSAEWQFFLAFLEIVRLIFTYLFLTLQKTYYHKVKTFLSIYNFRTSEIERQRLVE